MIRRASMDADRLAHQLASGARSMGLPLNTEQIRQMRRYAGLLERWSAVYNLSAIRDPERILIHHLLDCLALVVPLARWAAGRSIRILDVGTGAGLPGVVLAMAQTNWVVTTVDSVQKKAAFVRQVAGELGLANLHPLHGRIEALAPMDGFDAVVSRAFASLGALTALTAPRLAPGGVWVAMKGQRPEAEIAALPAGLAVFHVEPLRIPGLEAARCLVWIRPN